VRKRFERFAAGFEEKAQAGPAAKGQGTAQALEEDYWQSLQDLFTRDVTGKSLEDLEHDARDSFRFFTRDVDLSSLERKPWFTRYPLTLFKVFQAMAYRLSPPRRVLFAISVPLLFVGGFAYLVSFSRMGAVATWLLGAAGLLFVLLVLELRDKLALKGDLEIARQIQFGLLPFEPFEKDGLAVRAAMRPANTVGGDYFDLVELGDGKLAIVVGDVAGKGMPAALLMALLQASLRTLITAGLRGGELIGKLNAHLCAHIPSNRLVTLFYGEVDPTRGLLRYVNAGHNPPFVLRRDGTAERLAATSVALGILPDADFTPLETPLDGGDRLLLYTDGITEAANTHDVEYGDERLAAFLQGRRGASQQELIDGVLADVLTFCGSVRPRDDMTLLVLTRSA
jgi:serine phosphatase RsbU (regulator of sigma subunit)